MKATLRLLCFAVLFLLIREFAFGQGAATGDLHVALKDPKGSAVTNATVIVSNVAKGLERTATSDGQGGYSIRQLSPGTYTVTVDAPGFAKFEATEVAITVGGMAELPVALSVAGGKEVVEVSAQADLVDGFFAGDVEDAEGWVPGRQRVGDRDASHVAGHDDVRD